ncbi:sister chromatid cohesion protein 1 [Thecaphora frezii]
MFYSEVILAKKGPLARVWLAAHMERKLSKTQFLQTSIEKSVSAIMGQEVVPMALRLSGQLLLGVVRIYSRKAKYLLEDCNEALLKIKMAFRSGAVDMTSDQLNISRNAITLQDTRTDLDILLPDPALENWSMDFSRITAKKSKSKSSDGGNAHVARAADITLPHVDYAAFDDTFDISSGIDGIASQDFDPDGGLDLGLDLGLEDDVAADAARRDELGRLVDENGDPIAGGIEDDSMSIGVGRDAPSEAGRQSVGSLLNLGMEGDLQLGSELGGSVRAQSLGLPDFDMGVGGLDLGLDDGGLDLGLDGPEPMDVDEPEAPPRPVTPPQGENSMALAMADMTPTTAARIRDAAARRQQDEAVTKHAKARKQLIDARTELPESQLGGRPVLGSLSQGLSQGASQLAGADLDDILTEERYLPRSRAYLRLLTIRQDPTAHFLPYADPSNKDKSSFFIGPTGLAPELSEMFTFDLSAMRRRRAAAIADDEGPSKRARIEAEEDEAEVARRADESSRRESLGLGPIGEDSNLDITLGGNDFDLPPMDENLNLDLGLGDQPEDGVAPRRSQRKSRGGEAIEEESETGRLPALSRMSTPDAEGHDGSESFTPSLTNPLASFDVRPTDEKVQDEVAAMIASSEEQEATTQGWSKNTVRALRIVRSQLSAAGGASSSSAAAAEGEEAGEQEAEATQVEASRFVETDGETKKVSFARISQNASRRAAAGFFFEMLVLGTKDCVKLEQKEAYGDIKVSAKAKLWQTAAGNVRA